MQAGNVTRYPAAAVGTIPGTDAGGESVLLHLAVRGGFPDAEQLRGGYPAAAVPAHRAAAGTATAAPTPPTPHSSPLRVLASETREIASATLFIPATPLKSQAKTPPQLFMRLVLMRYLFSSGVKSSRGHRARTMANHSA